MHVALIKLNGWPRTFDERVREIGKNVDTITLVRPRPERGDTDVDDVANVRVRNVYPSRSKSVNRLWLHPILFPLHVVQATVILVSLSLTASDSPDVIHCLDYVLGGVTGAVVSVLTTTPLVVSVRGLTEPRYKKMVEQHETIVGRLNYRLLRLLPRVVFSRVDHIITKAEYQRTYLREKYDLAVPCSTIPTGVDYEVFDPRGVPDSPYPEELAGVEPGADTTTALFLGRITEEKGAATLLEHLTAADCTDVDLHLLYVGDFREEAFEETLQTLAADAPVPVTIHGERIPYRRVPELIANVDCVVLLSESKHEGVPRVLQEACVLETNVVAADVEGIAGAFADIDGCYLVRRDDPTALVESFKSVSRSDAHPDRETLRDRFDMTRNYQKYVEIYVDVTSR